MEPIQLIIGGFALVIIILIMMKEYKAKNLKELGEKFDIKPSEPEADKSDTKE